MAYIGRRLSSLSKLSVPKPFVLDASPSTRAWSLTTCAHASVPTMSTSAPCTTLAWMKTTSPVGSLRKPKPLSTNKFWTTSFATLVLSAKAPVRLESCFLSSFSSCSQSNRSSRLAATYVFAPRTRPYDGFRAALGPTCSDVAWRCEPRATMFGATWTSSCPRPCVSVPPTSRLHSRLGRGFWLSPVFLWGLLLLLRHWRQCPHRWSYVEARPGGWQDQDLELVKISTFCAFF